MDLHIRILLGYGWMVIWLIVAAAGAALGFHQLANQLEAGVTGNTRQIQTTLGIVEALERHDALVRRGLLGDAAARAEAAKGWSDLDKMLAAPAGDHQLDASAVERDLRWSFARYQELAEEALGRAAVPDLSPPSPPAEPLAAYERQAGEAFRAVKGQLRQLLEVNVRASLDRQNTEVQKTRRYAFVYGSVLVLVLISVGYLHRLLRRGLVDRLVALAQVAEAVSLGERHRRATAGPDDELGMIARQFNQLLDHDQALQAEMQGRLCQQRQMLVGFVQDAGRPLALYTIYGDLAVSNLEGKIREDLLASRFDFPKVGPEREQTFTTPFGKKNTLRFHLLRADGTRPVGWVGEVE